jgi:hypothetical protein
MYGFSRFTAFQVSATAAAVPPLLTREERMVHYSRETSRATIVTDPLLTYEDEGRVFLGSWTEPEKKAFKEEYLLHPKDFACIAASLDEKRVSQCVEFYYRSKKEENYKGFLTKKKKSPPQTPNPQAQVKIRSTLMFFI